jgi:hypothetical protein
MKRSLLVLLIFLVAATLPYEVSAAPPAGSPVADPSGAFAGLIELSNGRHI